MLADSPRISSRVMVAPPRRRIAAIIDGVTAITAFLGLYFGLMQLGSLFGYTNGLISGIVWSGPCILWLAVLLTLAWGGQTPGLALLRLRWVDQHGATARWRPAGEPHFWCLALSSIVLLAPYVVASVWMILWRPVWQIAHIRLAIPGTSYIAPGIVVTLLLMLGLGWLARRRPATLMRIGAR